MLLFKEHFCFKGHSKKNPIYFQRINWDILNKIAFLRKINHELKIDAHCHFYCYSFLISIFQNINNG